MKTKKKPRRTGPVKGHNITVRNWLDIGQDGVFTSMQQSHCICGWAGGEHPYRGQRALREYTEHLDAYR